MPVITDNRAVWNKPDGDNIVGHVLRGQPVTILDSATSKVWTKIQASPALSGWVDALVVNAAGETLGPIARLDFAISCRWQGDINQVVPHYLEAVAELRTQTQDGAHDVGQGPFALTTPEWTAFCQQTAADLNFQAADIATWESQVAAFAAMTEATTLRLATALGRRPSFVELYLAQIAGVAATAAAATNSATPFADVLTANPPVAADAIDPANIAAGGRDAALLAGKGAAVNAAINTALQAAFNATAADAQAADVKIGAAAGNLAPGGAGINFDSTSIPAGRQQTAQLIAQSFANANYGVPQQIAAIANAIAESALNPAAKSKPPEKSFGLFQLNLAGVGHGQDPAQLVIAQTNIDVMMKYIASRPTYDAAFKAATTVADATGIFCIRFEQPASASAQAVKRAAIAQTLLA